MAYSELIKSFGRIREYMRDFYVYGFRTRGEFGAGSARSYDNERRRCESWLGDAMTFRQDASGKRVFLSVDSRRIRENPLYKAFKAKSFTGRDVTLHFYILDILADGQALTAGQITDAVAERLGEAGSEMGFDESTVRKKLKEYVSLGMLTSRRAGKAVVYSLRESDVDLERFREAVEFFAAGAPVGVVGSYILDRLPERTDIFRFKHNYILHALDSEIVCAVLCAISARRRVELVGRSRTGRELRSTVCPLKLYVSTQTGREYVLGYDLERRRPGFHRLDSVAEVKALDVDADFEKYLGYCGKFEENLWGVSLGQGPEPELERVSMTVRVGPGEEFIVRRLLRERRHGTVERLGPDSWRFTAEVYDAMELVPWLRTFIGRIKRLECSNGRVLEEFRRDLEQTRELYGGDGNGVF